MVLVTVGAGGEKDDEPLLPRIELRADPDVSKMNPVTAATRQEPAASPSPNSAGVGAAWTPLRRRGHVHVLVHSTGSSRNVVLFVAGGSSGGTV